MSDQSGHPEAAWVDEMGRGLSWLHDEVVPVVWVYYDESGEYDQKGRLIKMTVGGCIAPCDRWRAFETQWRSTLAVEGLESFHMVDFEAWRPPFDFKMKNGDRDKEKHNRLLNGLLDTIIEHVEGIYGFSGETVLRSEENAHRRLLENSVAGAIKNAVIETWTFYRKPLHLVFDQQTHFPITEIRQYGDYYDLGINNGRVKSIIFGRAAECPPLGAADIVAYEMARIQRRDRPQRYPFSRLIEGARAKNMIMHLVFGPVRSR